MTTEAPERTSLPVARPRRQFGWALLAVAGLIAALLAGAGFGHPWSARSPLAPADYTRAYQLTQQHWSPDLKRCVTLTIGGTVYGTWTDPTWSLRGAGWTSLRLSEPSTDISVTADCSDQSAPAKVNDVRFAQYWTTEDCAEPIPGDWEPSTSDSANCPRNRVASMGPLADSPDSPNFSEPSTGEEGSSSAEVKWKGTSHGDSACLLGTLAVDVYQGSQSDAFTLDGFLVCLAPDSVTNPTG
jgi:hypothetical protein